jgi:hypothetical protein
MRRTVLLMAAAGALAALTACGPADTGTSSSPTTGGTAVSTSAADPTSAGVPTSVVAPAPVGTTQAPTTAAFAAFAMPRYVGMDLQSAQDAVQTHGIFYSISHDLRGSRHQILDSDWIVCTQNIAPGQQVTSDIEGQIDFGVVKRAETCP